MLKVLKVNITVSQVHDTGISALGGRYSDCSLTGETGTGAQSSIGKAKRYFLPAVVMVHLMQKSVIISAASVSFYFPLTRLEIKNPLG